MKLILFILFLLMVAHIPISSAACTTTCTVDDDGTGDYNVDHIDDAVEINQAIANVESYSSPSLKGTVILKYTSTPYQLDTTISINRGNIILRGENSGVTLRAADVHPAKSSSILVNANNIEIKDLTINGARSANGWPGGAGTRREIMLKAGIYPAKHDILIENITAYNTADDVVWGPGYNITVRNIDCDNLGHSCIFAFFPGNSAQHMQLVANWTIENIDCYKTGNSCFRTLSLNGVNLKNMRSSNEKNFGIELYTGDTVGYLEQNQYYENISIIAPNINGIILYAQKDVNSQWHFKNISFKNVLIDCQNECGVNYGDDLGSGVRIQSARDVTFDNIVINGSKRSGFLISNFYSQNSNIIIKNSIISNNAEYAIQQIDGNTNYDWNIIYNDFWNNRLGNTNGFVPLGVGNIGQDPQFASSTDFHPKSKSGRWTGTSWTTDSVTSPVIDKGDPLSDYTKEPTGNGKRINMGAYGNTIYASKSSSINYGVSGYVYDNNGQVLSGVIVNDGVYSSNTDDYGFYKVTGLDSGTYKFSYSKAGFNTGYLEVTITGSSKSNINMKIYDTTAPSVTGLTVTKTNNNTVTLSYDATGSLYKIYRDGMLKATTQDNSWIDTSVSLGNTYQYTVFASDTYGNQGSGSSVDITIYSYNVANLTPSIDTSIKSGQPDLMRSSYTWIDLGGLSGSNNGNYRGLLYFDISTIPFEARIRRAILTLKWEGENRDKETLIGVYRPSSSWDALATWNNNKNGASWTTQGGDWIDRNGVSYGSSPYAEVNYPAGSTSDAIFNVTSIIQEYVNGNYPNTGFILKANEIENTYIAFHSSEELNASQRPKLTIEYTTAADDILSNPAPSITDLTPSNLTIQYPVHISALFTVTTDQSVSNAWYSDGVNQNNDVQTWSNSWGMPGQHNVTYVGSNSNGSVSRTWEVSVIANNNPIPIPEASINFLNNGGLESGNDYWTFYTNGAGTFSIDSPGYEGNKTSRLTISKGGSNIQLYQTGVTLEPKTLYRLSFAAHSDRAHEMTVRLIKHGMPYTPYASDFTVNLGTSWQTFTTEFTSPSVAVSDGRLMFWLAPFVKAGDVCYIDDIRLEKI